MVSNKEMQELITSVYMPMLFYIPSGIFLLSPKKVPEGMESHPLFDTLLIIKENGEETLYREEFHALEIYKKEHVLNSNIYMLMEIKARNNEDAFKYLIENYIAQLRSYYDTYVWMCDHVEQDVVDVSDTAKNNLEFQKAITRQHLEVLETRFPEFDTMASESVESVLANTNIIAQKNDIQINGGYTIETPLVEPSKHKPQKRKKVLLATEREVDDYLLKTIFNVKVPKTTTKQTK